MNGLDFFTINMPSGMIKNKRGEWFVFNRDFLPLGWNSTDLHEPIDKDDVYKQIPVFTEYNGLTDALIESSIGDQGEVVRDADGNLKKVYFYVERTDPHTHKEFWGRYCDILLTLSMFPMVHKKPM